MPLYTCPNCHKPVRVGDHQLGKALRCGRCAGRFMADRALPPTVHVEDYAGEAPPVRATEAAPPPPVYDVNPPRSRRPLALGLVALVAVLGGVWGFVRLVEPHKHPRLKMIEKHLRFSANEPGSVDVQKVLYGPRGPDDDGRMTQQVWVGYRERNSFGAMAYTEVILTIVGDRYIQQGGYEHALLPSASHMDWSDNPDGPPLARRR